MPCIAQQQQLQQTEEEEDSPQRRSPLHDAPTNKVETAGAPTLPCPLSPSSLQQPSSQYYTYVHKNPLPKRRRPSNPERRVSFANEATAYRSPLTIKEVEDSWYTREELSTFKQNRRDAVRALKRVNFDASRIDQSVCCLRGYEAYSSVEFNRFLQKQRLLVTQTVLVEQERQRQQFIQLILESQRVPTTIEDIERSLPYTVLDPQRLCDICTDRTEWAKRRGIEVALQDAVESGFPPMTSIVVDDYDYTDAENEYEYQDDEDLWEDAGEDDEAETVHSQYFSVQVSNHSSSMYSNSLHSGTSTEFSPGIAVSAGKPPFLSPLRSSVYNSDDEPSLMSSICSSSTHSSRSASLSSGSFSHTKLVDGNNRNCRWSTGCEQSPPPFGVDCQQHVMKPPLRGSADTTESRSASSPSNGLEQQLCSINAQSQG